MPILSRPFLLSLLAHGLVLSTPLGMPLMMQKDKVSSPPLRITLLAAPTQTTAAAPRATSAPQAAPSQTIVSRTTALAVQRQVALETRPMTAAPAPSPAPSAATAPPVAALPSSPAPVLANSPSTEAPARASPDSTAPDNTALARYGETLGQLLAQHQRYPRLAEMRGWEGEVRLQLRIARKGALVDVQLSRSSGHDVLDRNALQLVQESPLPPLPANLAKDEEIRITIPIHYRLGRRPS